MKYTDLRINVRYAVQNHRYGYRRNFSIEGNASTLLYGRLHSLTKYGSNVTGRVLDSQAKDDWAQQKAPAGARSYTLLFERSDGSWFFAPPLAVVDRADNVEQKIANIEKEKAERAAAHAASQELKNAAIAIQREKHESQKKNVLAFFEKFNIHPKVVSDQSMITLPDVGEVWVPTWSLRLDNASSSELIEVYYDLLAKIDDLESGMAS